MELIVKKCLKCGAVVIPYKDCNCDNCGIKCCNEEMVKLIPNTVDAAIEKHIPTYEIDGDKISVKVNHVMEEDHYIEFIALESEDKLCIKNLKPGMEPVVSFKYIKGSKVYAYCNKHDLWVTDIK